VPDRRSRPFLYVAAKEGGLLVLELPAGGGPPTRAAAVPRDAIEHLDAISITQAGTRLYVALGNFFGGGPSTAGLAIVDVADPRAPRVEAVWTSDRPLGGSADVLVHGGIAWLAAMEAGVLALDVSGPVIRSIGSIVPDPDFPRPDPGAVQRPNARALALRDSLLFVAYDAGGLRVLDVSDPGRPREVGRYINVRMPDKQQAYNDLVLDGPYAYVTLDYCGLEILDIRDPTRPRQAGWWNPWSCDRASNLWFNSPGHTNQIEFDAAGRRVYVSAGDSELQVIDVSDPARPRLADSWGRPRNGRGAWGLAMDDEAVYLAYIRSAVPFRSDWAGIAALPVR
jgi:hypothetical protein